MSDYTEVTTDLLNRQPPTKPESHADAIVRRFHLGELDATQVIDELMNVVRLTSRYAALQHQRAEENASRAEDRLIWKKRAEYAESEVERMKKQRAFLKFQVRYIPEKELLRYPAGEYVYLIHDMEVTGYYKIGRTDNPSRRLTQFGVQLPFRVGVVHIIPTNDSKTLERQLHEHFKSQRARGEWFNLTDDDVLTIVAWQA
jgi:hypothetical protein